jgi:hypothetical protein
VSGDLVTHATAGIQECIGMSVSATHWSWPVMSDSRQPSIMERWGGLICAVAMLAVVAGDRMIGAGGSTAEIKSGLATLKDQNAQFAIRIDGLADRGLSPSRCCWPGVQRQSRSFRCRYRRL